MHPWEGETEPLYTDFEENGKYSWCKAPRLAGQPVQVGPTAQILAAYAAGQPQVKALVDSTCRTLKITPNQLGSTMGRLVARALRASLMADLSLHYLDKLA